MQTIREGFYVHETVFDGHSEEMVIQTPFKASIYGVPDALVVTPDFRFARPVLRGVPGQRPVCRIDAERKETIEFRPGGLHPVGAGTNEVPLECFQVAQVKHKPVTLGDWPFIEGFGLQETEDLVRA